MKKKAVFLDRDGTILDTKGGTTFINFPEQVHLLPGVAEAVRCIQERGYAAVLVTNQGGVGEAWKGQGGLEKPYLTRRRLDRVHQEMEHQLAGAGVELDGIYVCPHAPQAGCPCRKPRTGMVDRAIAELNLTVEGSYMVGDMESDVGLARHAGLTAVLVLTGQGEETLASLEDMDGVLIVADLCEFSEKLR
jgi:D-glycero-D-manno-heptose 1,7-bisphosphate phosphatase